jgi:predicted nucleotidyltransferase
MLDLIKNNIDNISNLCKKHKVKQLFLFGSALTNKFNENSDLDFAVIFNDQLSPIEHGESFFNLLEDLENLLKIQIDLISYRAVKNPIFKEELDNTKYSLYAAA